MEKEHLNAFPDVIVEQHANHITYNEIKGSNQNENEAI